MLIVDFLLVALKRIKDSISRVWQSAKYKTQYPDCKVYPGAVLINSKLGGYNILFYDVQLINSVLGAHTYIQKRSSIVNAQIGKFCSVASDVTVGPGIHKTDTISTHPAFYLNSTPLIKKYSARDLFESSKCTLIGHDVWIGEKAIILDGISIGTGAIVAAGAVVTKNVEPFTVVGGVPAKVIKARFTQEEIDVILKSAWWDRDEEWLKKNYKAFSHTDEFKKLMDEKLS